MIVEQVEQDSQENQQFDKKGSEKEKLISDSSPKKDIKIFQKNQSTPKEVVAKYTEFNLDNIPPNWKYAEDHLKARVNGPEDNAQPTNICDCCGYNVNRHQLSINCDITELSFLGSGFPLLFVFIKYCAIICMILFLISGVYNIVTNSISNDCFTVDEIEDWLRKKPEYINWSDQQLKEKAEQYAAEPDICFSDFFSIISLANKYNEGGIMLAQGILNFVTVIAIIGLLYFFRKIQRKTDIECDESNISPSDYSIWVQNIPIGLQGFDYDDSLKKFFEKEVTEKLGTNVKVKAISLGFNLEELESLEKQKFKLLAQKSKAIKKYNNSQIWPTGDSLETLDSQIIAKDKEMQALEAKMVDGTSNKFCGTAFLSFNTEDLKNKILKNFGVESKDRLIFQSYPLEIRQSPEPNAILWHNLRFTKKQQLIRKIISFTITLILMGTSFVSIFYLNKWQIGVAEDAAKYKEGATKEKLLGLFISVIIVVINVALGIAIQHLSLFIFTIINFNMKVLKNIMQEQDITLVMRKKLLLYTSQFLQIFKIQFFNIAFIMFLVSITLSQNIIGRGGLIVNVSTLFLTNSVLPPIMQALRIPYYIKYILRWRARKLENKSSLTQKQAQDLYEHPVFGIEQVYCELLKTIFFSAFYFTIIPFGMLLTSIELIGLYWIYKGSALMFFLIMNEIESDAIQPEYFSAKEKYHDAILGILCAGLFIGVVNAIFPWQYINERFFPEREDEPLDITYGEAKEDFDTNFDIENPATRRIAVSKLVQKREGKDSRKKKKKKTKKQKKQEN